MSLQAHGEMFQPPAGEVADLFKDLVDQLTARRLGFRVVAALGQRSGTDRPQRAVIHVAPGDLDRAERLIRAALEARMFAVLPSSPRPGLRAISAFSSWTHRAREGAGRGMMRDPDWWGFRLVLFAERGQSALSSEADAPRSSVISALAWPKRVMTSRGLVVAFLGVDGVGKSTQESALADFLCTVCGAGLTHRHVRPRLLPPLGRVVGRALGRAPASEGARPPESKPASGLAGSVLRLIWLWLDYWLGHVFVVKAAFARGQDVVLFDRYAHDMVLDQRKFRVSLPKWVREWFVRSVPQPDLIVCLTADPEAVVRRKSELTLEDTHQGCRRIRRLAQQVDRAVLVPTDGTERESLSMILTELHATIRNAELPPKGEVGVHPAVNPVADPGRGVD